MNSIQGLVGKFTKDLEAEIRQQVVAEVRALLDKALGGDNRAPKRSAVKKARTKAGKRTPAQIERLAARLLDYIKANPGQRSEQISTATGISTADLVLPIRKLLAGKNIKSKGKARGTTYAVA
jgi:hypothetical protein